MPVSAMVMAKTAATAVLPASGAGLMTVTECICSPSKAYMKLVRQRPPAVLGRHHFRTVTN